jgi:hypothetical protein
MTGIMKPAARLHPVWDFKNFKRLIFVAHSVQGRKMVTNGRVSSALWEKRLAVVERAIILKGGLGD